MKKYGGFRFFRLPLSNQEKDENVLDCILCTILEENN